MAKHVKKTGLSCQELQSLPSSNLQEVASEAEFPSVRVNIFLLGGLEHVLFFHILGIFIPIDFHIFQRGRSTTK